MEIRQKKTLQLNEAFFEINNKYELHIFVSEPKHIAEFRDFHSASFCFRRFFEISFSSNVTNCSFAVESFL